MSAAEEVSSTSGRIEIRFAFSTALFAEVNENDAKAAVKVYTRAIGTQNGISVDDAPALLSGTKSFAQALQFKQADLFVLTADEFFALENLGLDGPLLLSNIKQVFTEEYVLLSRGQGAFSKVEDLKGRNLVISSDARACLATIWLEVLCRQHGFGSATQFFANVTYAAKSTQVVLPVFFGKTDACITTRSAWEVMCELNPQLKKQLQVMAVCPRVVPTLTCFRRGLSDPVKQQIIKAVELSATRSGYKQLMEMFKTDGLCQQPLSALDGTRELVATFRRLCLGIDRSEETDPDSGVVSHVTEGNGK